MLTILQNQLDTFTTAARARFLDEVTRLLHEAEQEQNGVNLANLSKPSTSDRREVEKLAKKAESFGLRSNESIGVFLQASFFIGSDFYDVFIPASEVLRSHSLDESTKRKWLKRWYFSLLKPNKADSK